MKRARKILSLVARLALAVLVLGWLFSKMDVSRLAATLRSLASAWPLVLAAFVVSATPMFFSIARWRAILSALDMKLPWKRVARIFLVGAFFNTFMVGSTGGDLVKAYYAARETRHRKTEAVTSVFIDRVIGLLVLAMLLVVIIVVRWSFYGAHTQTSATALTALSVCGTVIVGALAALSVHWFEVWPALRRWQTRPLIGKALATAERAYNAFYVCRSHPRLLLVLAFHSLGVQLTLVAAIALLGRALGLTLSFTDYLCVSPLVGLISSVPATPGGVGIREFANVNLFAALAVPNDKALVLSLVSTAFLILWSLPGGIVFLLQGSAVPDGDESVNSEQ